MKNYLVESMTSLMKKANRDLHESISGWNEDEYSHYTFRCQDCMALVAGDNDEWICDEVEKSCSQVIECPEGMGILVDASTSEPVEEHLISDYDYDEYTDDVVDAYNRGEITAEEKHAEYERLGRMLDETCNSESKKELTEDINTSFIKIYKEGQPVEDGWDYPIDELEYLLEEHPGESFILNGDRLYEMNEE